MSKIKIKFSYVEDAIPPGCRKARAVNFFDGDVLVTIQQVTGEQAPVAIVADYSSHHGSFKGVLNYRWFNGVLWTASDVNSRGVTKYRSFPSSFNLNEPGASPYFMGFKYGLSYTKAQTKSLLKKYMARHLIIDGVLHKEASEPGYHAMTFGLGNNHGGSALMVASVGKHCSKEKFCFSLLEKDQALAYATKMAQDRGDDKSLPMTVNGPDFVVLMPEAIKFRSK